MRRIITEAVAKHSTGWSTVDLTSPVDNLIVFASKFQVITLPSFPMVYVDLDKLLVWVKPGIQYYVRSASVRSVVYCIWKALLEFYELDAKQLLPNTHGLLLLWVAQATALKEQEECDEVMRLQMQFQEMRHDEVTKQLAEIRQIRDEICIAQTRAELGIENDFVSFPLSESDCAMDFEGSEDDKD